MKIEHLLEIIEPRIKDVYIGQKRFRDKTSLADVNVWALSDKEKSQGVIGAGNYSVITQDKKRPDIVRKTTRRAIHKDEDGAWAFLHYVAKEKLWKNPYFPKVYEVKRYYTDGSDKSHYRAKIEKLAELEALPREAIIKVISVMLAADPEDLGIVQPYHKKSDLLELIEEIISRVLSGKLPKHVDPKLVEAIGIIKKMNESFGFGYDIHHGNIAVRINGDNVQPVIIDPFSIKPS